GVRLGPERGAVVLRLGGGHEGGLHAEAAQGDVELGDGAAVQLRGGDDVVARAHQCREGDELGAHPGGGGDRADPALEGGDALLEGGGRGVADAGVDVAVLLQRVGVRGGGRIVEDERGGLVDRDRARAVLGVRRAARVQGAGAEPEGALRHGGGHGGRRRSRRRRRGRRRISWRRGGGRAGGLAHAAAPA